jgi:hypothetical protein
MAIEKKDNKGEWRKAGNPYCQVKRKSSKEKGNGKEG